MLKRLSFWSWFVIITLGLYIVYNPLGFSIYHMWALHDVYDLFALKLLFTTLVTVSLGLISYGTWRSIGFVGIAILVFIIALLLLSIQTLTAASLFDIAIFSWIGQVILGFILTLGWQWPKIWRHSTGAVSVEDPDTPEGN